MEQFRYIAIEGPLGVGKAALADRLGARLDATMVLDEGTIRSWPTSTAGVRGRLSGAAVLHARAASPQSVLRQSDLFSQVTVCDYLFERDKIYADLNLDDNELFIYQRLYELLSRGPVAGPRDLPADADRRAPPPGSKERARAGTRRAALDDEYIRELNEAYNHFFFHYSATRCSSSKRPSSICPGATRRSRTS